VKNMTEQDQRIEDFLHHALAPPERQEDHAFGARVQALARVEDRWAAERSAAWRRFTLGMVAIAAFALGMAVIMAAPSAVEAVIGDRPTVLALFIAGFGAWVAVLARPDSHSGRSAGSGPVGAR
jgi:hypothetical protein